jgi:hypothetical protein
MIMFYMRNWRELNGSIHLPLTYHILETQKLIYKAVVDCTTADYAYSFYNFNPKEFVDKNNSRIVEVPAMSTCGMLINRQYLDRLGYWPTELGIYSGGEHFMNYAMAALGMKKWIYAGDPLCHHGDKRGYNWNHHDQQRNRAVALYIVEGVDALDLWLEKRAKLTTNEKRSVRRSVLSTCHRHRELIKNRRVKPLMDFIFEWAESDLMVGNY